MYVWRNIVTGSPNKYTSPAILTAWHNFSLRSAFVAINVADYNKTYLAFYARCPKFVSGFSQISEFLVIDFHNSHQNQILRNSLE
jgi:hypothetical protein